MLDSIRALIVVLVVSGVSFWMYSKPTSTFISYSEFSRWRKTWIIIVVIAFLSPNYLIFIAISSLILFAFVPGHPEQRVIYYFLLLCALPSLSYHLPGVGGIQYLFQISYPRLLVLALFIPIIFETKRSHSRDLDLFKLPSDLYVVLYVLVTTILIIRDNTITSIIRDIFIIAIDIFIPYYIISRNITSLAQFNRAFTVLLIAITLLALLGIFESAKYWNLYHRVSFSLTGHSSAGQVLARAGAIRATTIFYSPIILGYVLTIGFGLLLYIRPLLNSKKLFYAIAAVIIIALLATVSRGPWVGFVVLMIAYVWTGPNKIKNLSLSLLVAIIVLPFLSLTPFWDKFVSLLPFVGSAETGTISYRERLLENAWIVFQNNPLFGSNNYLNTPEMESMRQGQGIIDMVNSYIQIGLKTGLAGLSLFLLIFIGLISRTYIMVKKLPQEETDMIRLGRVLFAILSAIVFTIGTVSSLEHIPIFYWAFAGLTAAYINLAKRTIEKAESSTTQAT